MIEKGQPDLASEATPSLLGEVYSNGSKEGRISQIGTALPLLLANLLLIYFLAFR